MKANVDIGAMKVELEGTVDEFKGFFWKMEIPEQKLKVDEPKMVRKPTKETKKESKISFHVIALKIWGKSAYNVYLEKIAEGKTRKEALEQMATTMNERGYPAKGKLKNSLKHLPYDKYTKKQIVQPQPLEQSEGSESRYGAI